MQRSVTDEGDLSAIKAIITDDKLCIKIQFLRGQSAVESGVESAKNTSHSVFLFFFYEFFKHVHAFYIRFRGRRLTRLAVRTRNVSSNPGKGEKKMTSLSPSHLTDVIPDSELFAWIL